MGLTFNSNVFEKEEINLGGTTEYIVRGGRHLFNKLPKNHFIFPIYENFNGAESKL